MVGDRHQVQRRHLCQRAGGDEEKQQHHGRRRASAALKQEGITLSDLRVRFERQFIIQNVIGRELQRNMTLTEEEMRQYFNTHQSEFMKPPTVTLREILIPVATET
jgi:peptidyl-prolyl cis-trans isomerase SurA